LKLALGADHAGRAAKDNLARMLREMGHEVTDCGTDSDASCDYPDFAARVCQAVTAGQCERGILVCGTGVGMSMAANRVPGIRAAACQQVEAARLSRAHNDANVLCLGARLNTAEALQAMTDVWLTTAFEGGRHARRVEKINSMSCAGGADS
jgi:ribose 5-phosphate isomerase B